MRIMYLHAAGILGGSERVFLDLFTRLPKQEQDQAIIVIPSAGPFGSEIRRLNSRTQIIILPFPLWTSKATQKRPLLSLLYIATALPAVWSFTRKLSLLVQEKAVAVIYSNGVKFHLLSLLIRSQSKAKLVWHLHEFFPKMSYVLKFLNVFKNGPELILANSHSVLEHFARLKPEHWNSKQLTVHNGVDTRIYSSTNEPNSGHVILTMIGMLTAWKGQHLFLEAASALTARYKNLKFLIVGDEVYETHGEIGYRAKLEELVKKLNLADFVEFRGFVKDLTDVYEQSDIVVHASQRPEPFGRVIIEAMAFARPVIATRGGGVIEIIRDGIDGLLVEMGSVYELSQAMERLIQKEPLRRSLGRQARDRVVQHFSADAFATRVHAALQELA
jgi:glycosyltransferase involved in cell wall biosynthesis